VTATGPREAAAQERAKAVADAIAKRAIVREHHTTQETRVELAADAMYRIENLEQALAAAIEQIRHLTQRQFDDLQATDAKITELGAMLVNHSHPSEIVNENGVLRIVPIKGAA